MLVVAILGILSLILLLKGYAIILEVACIRTSSILLICDQSRLIFIMSLSLIVVVILQFMKEYMGGIIYFYRFYWLLIRFVVSMLILLISSNLLFLLVGWDGLGVTRFLLIAFYKRRRSWGCSLKTFLVNRLGDGLLLAGVCMAICSGYSPIEVVTFSGLKWLIILGLITKAAQYPFRGWLPAAMAAPTPVSALVHSSTLVTRGVYVLYRLDLSGGLACIRLWTILIARIAAIMDYDVKKIIAFSTLSQIGFMVFALSIGLSRLAFLHLLRHAFFKANLFIGSGYYLMYSNHSQDIRLIVVGRDLVKISIIVRIISLKGLCFLCGFYSKDSLIDQDAGIVCWWLYLMLFLGIIGTAMYRLRLISRLSLKYETKIRFRSIPFLLRVVSIIFGWCVTKRFLALGFPSFKILILLLIIVGCACSLVKVDWFGLRFSSLEYLASRSLVPLVNYFSLIAYTLDKGIMSPISIRVRGRLEVVFWQLISGILVLFAVVSCF